MSENLSITDHALQMLNTLQGQDPAACAALVTHKVQVPEAIADHDDFICQTARGGKTHLSVLGFINSLLVKTGNPKIAAIVEDDDTVIGFTKRIVEKPAAPASTPPSAAPKN